MSAPRVLVLAAHPDDEVLGCGGSIARLARAGCAVRIAILGEGDTARYADPGAAPDEPRARLREQCSAVAELLGAEVEQLDFPDNRLDTVPLLEVVHAIEDLIERHRPEIVYTQSGGDLNVDHSTLFRATLTATRPVPGCPVRELYAYEVVSSTEWAFGQLAPAFHPNTFVDIGLTLELKLRALAIYTEELREFPHPRSLEGVRAQAERWGSSVGVRAAEAFQLVRAIR